MNIKEILFSVADDGYKSFHSQLVPTVEKEKIIGVKIPVLRKISKEIINNKECLSFLDELPHEYYEENNLHAFLIEQINDFDEALDATKSFLPYIDNWATCDSFKPKIFQKHKKEMIPYIAKWIKSSHIYTVRFGINQLMTHFLDDDFEKKHLMMVADIKSDEYYVNMMRAWYFATALTKQYDAAIKILEEQKIDMWTHNKIIRKACESYRIDNNTKEYLKTLKRM